MVSVPSEEKHFPKRNFHDSISLLAEKKEIFAILLFDVIIMYLCLILLLYFEISMHHRGNI